MPRVFSIGHSNHEIDSFIGLLKKHGISAIADVRSSPYSRFLPHFNREKLKTSLHSCGIHYVFLGDELGARREEQECYNGDVAEYRLIAKTKAFRDGIDRIISGAASYKICLMCAEKDPLTCHRAILVSKELSENCGFTISHILENGNIETQDEVAIRLLKEYNRETLDMFVDRESEIAEVYAIRAEAIQYQRKDQNTELYS